jgi:hypothetical protein
MRISTIYLLFSLKYSRTVAVKADVTNETEVVDAFKSSVAKVKLTSE